MPRWEPLDPTLTEKRCVRCKRFKNKEEFPKSRRTRDGLYPYCKECSRAAKIASAQRVRARDPQGFAERAARNKRAYKERSPDVVARSERKNHLKQYGITIEEYEQLLKQQRGRCAICRRLPTQGGKRFFVDHCHRSKKVRGLLCRKCNTAIGLLGDTAKAVKRAYEYLEKAECG